MFEEFRNNFIKCQLGPYKISKSLSDFLNSLCINVNDEYNNLGPIAVNQNLVNKISSNNNFLLCQGRNSHYDHFHPPKINQSTQNVIDEMYKQLFELFKPTVK